MRRHYTNYLKGIPDVKSFRMQLVNAVRITEIEAILQELENHVTEMVM